MLDRARRIYSMEQDKAVTTVEVLEWALASYISNQLVDDETLEKVRLEMDKDLQAEKSREIPLVARARGVAEEMGLIPICEEGGVECEIPRAGDSLEEALLTAIGASPCSELRAEDERIKTGQPRAGKNSAEDLLAAIGALPFPEVFADNEMPKTISASAGGHHHPIFRAQSGETEPTERLDQTDSTKKAVYPDRSPVRATSDYLRALENIFPPIKNKNVCFNPYNRHATKAQKREVLRREGWCCATPGCPHKIWLHLHHLIPYSQGGPTLAHNLLGICVACHCNVHDGSSRIFLDDKGRLQFTDADGNSLAEQADLMLAGWFDFNEGWNGEREDSYKMRWGRGEWSVFEHPR